MQKQLKKISRKLASLTIFTFLIGEFIIGCSTSDLGSDLDKTILTPDTVLRGRPTLLLKSLEGEAISHKSVLSIDYSALDKVSEEVTSIVLAQTNNPIVAYALLPEASDSPAYVEVPFVEVPDDNGDPVMERADGLATVKAKISETIDDFIATEPSGKPRFHVYLKFDSGIEHTFRIVTTLLGEIVNCPSDPRFFATDGANNANIALSYITPHQQSLVIRADDLLSGFSHKINYPRFEEDDETLTIKVDGTEFTDTDPPQAFTEGDHPITITRALKISSKEREAASCTYSITITATPDITPPTVIFCPTDIIQTFAYIDGEAGFMLDYFTALASIQYEDLVLNYEGAEPLSFPLDEDGFELIVNDEVPFTNTNDFRLVTSGEGNVKVRVRDLSGNLSETCEYSYKLISVPPLTIENCPPDSTTYVMPGSPPQVIKWDEPAATLSSGTVTSKSTRASGELFPIGSTTVTYTFTDFYDHTATCTFDVTVVEDVFPPIISGCPTDGILASFMPGSLARYVRVHWDEPTATDESGTVSFHNTRSSGATFSLGASPVTYTFTDRYANVATCTFDVTVAMGDASPPIISGCPTDGIFSYVGPGSPPQVIEWDEPTATDSSGTVTSTSTSASGDLFSMGRSTVTYTFADRYNNVATCTFDVNVIIDATPPVIAYCPSLPLPATPLVRYFNASTSQVTVRWDAVTAIDNGGEAVRTETSPSTVVRTDSAQHSFTHTLSSLTDGARELLPFTYTFIDNLGNRETCTFEVEVIVDATPPVIVACPSAPLTAYFDGATSLATVRWDAVTATDNNGAVVTIETSPSTVVVVLTDSAQHSFTHTLSSLTHDTHDAEPIIYTFTDSVGNSTSCRFVLNFRVDTISPNILSCGTGDDTFYFQSTEGVTIDWANGMRLEASSSLTTYDAAIRGGAMDGTSVTNRANFNTNYGVASTYTPGGTGVNGNPSTGTEPQHTVTLVITAIDAAGNISSNFCTKSYILRPDDKPPYIQLTNPLNNADIRECSEAKPFNDIADAGGWGFVVPLRGDKLAEAILVTDRIDPAFTHRDVTMILYEKETDDDDDNDNVEVKDHSGGEVIHGPDILYNVTHDGAIDELHLHWNKMYYWRVVATDAAGNISICDGGLLTKN